jgi:hypothetical protein
VLLPGAHRATQSAFSSLAMALELFVRFSDDCGLFVFLVVILFVIFILVVIVVWVPSAAGP